MASPFVVKKELVDCARKLYLRGFLAGTDGNLSVRLDDDRIMVTPTGQAKGELAPDNLVIVDINGKHLQGSAKASSELAMHLRVYQQRAEIRACIHTHAPYATAFAVAGLHLDEPILPEVVLFVGGIPLTDYAAPGTEAVPQALDPHLEGNSAFLLRNHGLLTIGRSLDEAWQRHETVEHYARIVHLARQLGNVERIPSDDFKRLEAMRRRMDEAWEGRG